MADALISPAVGGTVWAAAAGLTVYSARKVRSTLDDRRVPLMGVMGAFVFAAQMINFTIPGTGSSGHIGGGLLLAILLGPPAAFITIASILAVQALFFADGGLLALGCNIINLGLFPCFIAYPLVYLPLTGKKPTAGRLTLAAVTGSVVGLQLGAFGVVMETTLSGISDLPFGKFVMLMQPIHLAIGVVEGLAIAAVVGFVRKARPEVLQIAPAAEGRGSLKPVLIGLAIATALTGGVLSWYASTRDDGLEWAIGKALDKTELPEPEAGVHASLKHVQESTAFMPDYEFPAGEAAGAAEPSEAGWGTPSVGRSVAGLIGGAIVLLVAAGAAWLIRRRKPAGSAVT